MRVMNKLMMITLICGSAAFGAEPEAREWKNTEGTVVKFRWSAPDQLDAGKTYPLILFLHGSGERGNDNSAQLKNGVTPILEGAAKLGEKCFLIAPQCPEELWWAPIDPTRMHLISADKPNALLDAVVALIGETMKNHPVDPKRIYVTGLSMGGFASWDLLGRMPEKIAAAIPICGGGDPALVARYKDIPVWAFHGEADPIVPVAATRQMIAALEKAGSKPKVTFYPEVQHDSWTQTYADPEVIRWLFAQRKN